jgi:hypothetical protein
MFSNVCHISHSSPVPANSPQSEKRKISHTRTLVHGVEPSCPIVSINLSTELFLVSPSNILPTLQPRIRGHEPFF